MANNKSQIYRKRIVSRSSSSTGKLNKRLRIGSGKELKASQGSILPSASQVLRFAQSPRLVALERLRRGQSEMNIHICLNANHLSSDEILRRFEGLVDALESFLSGRQINLKIRCDSYLRENLLGRLPSTPRTEMEFIEPARGDALLERLAGLIEDPLLQRILDAVMVAANCDSELTLAMTLETFPIRPLSAEALINCCHELSWLDHALPDVGLARMQVLPGPALFERVLAASVLGGLMARMNALASMNVAHRHAAVVDEIIGAELGFWSPKAQQNAVRPLVRRTCIENLAWPWAPQPWKTDNAPYLLWLEDSIEVDGELILQRIYDTLHR